jgi:hypothetical protein
MNQDILDLIETFAFFMLTPRYQNLFFGYDRKTKLMINHEKPFAIEPNK